jgi:hypothetical protein
MEHVPLKVVISTNDKSVIDNRQALSNFDIPVSRLIGFAPEASTEREPCSMRSQYLVAIPDNSDSRKTRLTRLSIKLAADESDTLRQRASYPAHAEGEGSSA